MELSSEMKKDILSFLTKKLDPELIYLYGSFARSEGRLESDVDLAVYTQKQTDPYGLFLLANELAMDLKLDVDLVDLKTVSTVFRAQVVSSGEALFYRDDLFKAEYEIRSLKDYAKLNEERKPILDRIKEEGSIYGHACHF